jgi:NitT/TauT family transport system substrate-binding protein
MNKNIKKFMSAILVTSIAFGLAACGSGQKAASGVESTQKKDTIKIGYLPITHALPLYVENELAKDNFKETNLELVKFGSWPELVDALNTGKIDGASVLIELAMKAKEQGIDLKAVSLGHRDGNVAVVSPHINNVSDLKGKNFAIPHRLSTHNILLYKMLKKAGLSQADVNVIELPPAEMPAALAEGRISGYIVAEPFGAKAVAINKGKVLLQSKDLWADSVCCALVLRDEFIKNHNDSAQEFVNEYVAAGEKAETKDGQIHEISSKYMKVDQKVLDLSLKWISYNDLKIHEKDYDELRNTLIEMNLSQNPPKYTEFVDNSLINKAK